MCKRLSMPGVRCSLYYMSRFRFSRVDDKIRMTFPAKRQRVASSPHRNIYHLSLIRIRLGIFLAFSIDAIFTDDIPTYFVSRRKTWAMLSPAAQYIHSMSAWRGVLSPCDGRISKNISDSGIDETEKWGAQRKRHTERFQYDGAFAFNAFLFFCRCDYSLYGYTMAIVCVRPVDDTNATPKNIYWAHKFYFRC